MVVGLEDHPLGADEDGFLEVVEVPADVEVAPGRVGGQGAGAPDADAAAGERADAVDADRVEEVLLTAGDLELQVDGAADDLVGRGLVDAALGVVAGPDAGHVAARRDQPGLAAGRVEGLDPRVVQGGVVGVVAGRLLAPDPDLTRVQAGRRVDDGDAVAHQLAVRDETELDGLDGLQVDRAALVGGHQVGDGDHGHLVDGLQAAEAGAVGGVAEVLGGAGVTTGVLDRGGVRGGGRGGGEGDGLVLGADELRGGRGLGHGDELGALLDLGDHVVAAALLGGHVEGLDGLAAVLDDELEALGGALALGVGDLDAQVAGAGGRDAERAELLGLARGQRGGAGAGAGQGGRGAVQRGALARGPSRCAADADDVGGRTAVVEEPVDRVREVVPLGELAERRDVLRPVGHQRRLVERSGRGESDEGGDGRTHPFDRTRAAGHLLDVDAGRQVGRHVLRSSGVRDTNISQPHARARRPKRSPVLRFGQI